MDVRVHGHDDILYDVHAVEFRLAGRPGTRVRIGRDATEDLTESPSEICLIQLGKWHFRTRRVVNSGEVISYGGCVDIGSEGEFAEKLPFAIRSVQDLVSRYDDLLREFETWPTDESIGTLTSGDAVIGYYATQDPDHGWASAWEQEALGVNVDSATSEGRTNARSR